jgi:hypothetical protein
VLGYELFAVFGIFEQCLEGGGGYLVYSIGLYLKSVDVPEGSARSTQCVHASEPSSMFWQIPPMELYDCSFVAQRPSSDMKQAQ